MADEFKTLLKIEGDASGAKAAASEAKDALGELGQASAAPQGVAEAAAAFDELAAKIGLTAEQAAALRKHLGDAGAAGVSQAGQQAGQAGTEFNRLAQTFGTSEKDARAFYATITRINPQLGMLMDGAMKAGESFAFLKSSLGLWTIGAVVAIGAVVKAIQFVRAESKKAQQQLDDLAAANERMRSAARAREGGVAATMAAAGMPAAATPKARSIAERLAEQGIDPTTAAQAAPFLVTPEGEAATDADEAFRMAAAMQAGQIQPSEARTPEQARRARERMQRQLARQRRREAAENAADQIAEQQAKRAEELATGRSVEDIAKYLEDTEGLTGEEAKERATRIQEELQGRRRARQAISSLGMPYGGMAPAGLVPAPIPAEDDPQTAVIRDRARQAREQAERIGPQAAAPTIINKFYGHTFTGGAADRFATHQRFLG